MEILQGLCVSKIINNIDQLHVNCSIYIREKGLKRKTKKEKNICNYNTELAVSICLKLKKQTKLGVPERLRLWNCIVNVRESPLHSQ